MKLCLNMIVKNEGARIQRALASAAPWIDSWVIIDTGSTDDTKQKIIDFFGAHHIIGEIRDAPFVDWSQARNAALNWARKLSFAYQPDYFLLMDADMELRVVDQGRFISHRAGPSYDMYQVAGTQHYQNRRLVHASVLGQYVGVTHEYLDIVSGGLIDEDVAYFLDHSDGANRPDKFKRDIRLLLADMKKDPNNVRSMFYLGCSYRDAGKPDRAAKMFKRRVDAGGWDEEVWQAQVNYAHCLRAMKDEPGFIREMLVAYAMRPSRGEALYDLAKHYREKGMSAPALAFAEAGVHLPISKDALFVNNYVYTLGLKQEVSISAFYVPGKRRLGYKTTSELMMNLENGWVRDEARTNIIHYVEPLAAFCPSFKWEKVPFDPPPNWIAMNPSITMHGSLPAMNVRCVNYRIDNEGRYLIRGNDGEANGTNPINTRNFVMTRLQQREWTDVREVFAPANLPCEFPPVIGFEDMRLISWGGQLHASSTVRQIHPDGNCEQVLTRLEDCTEPGSFVPALVHGNVHRMLRHPRQTEKNWAPIVRGGELQFMWRPLELVDTNGVTVRKQNPGVDVGNISGGSQLVKFRFGWLAVVHEARYFQGTYNRFYLHRFVWYDEDFTRAHFSLPFYFNDKAIEFCAGMCWDPNGVDLLLSYGYKDEEARLATVSANDVEDFLWPAKC
jgi:glycosyltransferase involved in cell wall biosynthesis